MSEVKLDFNRIEQAKGSVKKGPKDANVQYFNGDYHEKTDILVRETIQNPLDNPSGNGPVKILFRQRYVNSDEIPNKKDLIQTMESLCIRIKELKRNQDGIASGFVEFYNRAIKSLRAAKIGILQISDFNTTGLTGSKNDMSTNIGRFLGGVGFWDDESSGGGSGGLGKYAPFKFSGVNFCLYSSYNTDGEYVYYGWGSNFTHELNGVEYSGEINMGATVNGDYDVYKTTDKVSGGFLSEREELGTDVFALDFIKGEQGSFHWSDEMAKAVIRNFFGAIIDGKLIVEIDEYQKENIIVDKESIIELLSLFDESEKKSSRNIIADGYTVEGVQAFIKGDVFVSDPSSQTPLLGKCIVKVLQDEDFSSCFTYMRGPRMFIKSSRVRAGDLPFAGVFICDSREGNNALRNLEDSHHKDWIYTTNEDRKIRTEINTFVRYCVEKVAKFNNPDEFELKGTRLLSLGISAGNSPGSGEGEDENEAAVVIPKNVSTKGVKANHFWGEYKVSKDGKKKQIKPKKPKNKKPKKPQKPNPSSDRNREYKVDDFEAVIFKNDNVDNEYHLYIESNEHSNIRTIDFEIPGASEVAFVDSVIDDFGNPISRDTRKGKGLNAFENLVLSQGQNKFIVKTSFNKKVQINIT